MKKAMMYLIKQRIMMMDGRAKIKKKLKSHKKK